jgi:Fic family protein
MHVMPGDYWAFVPHPLPPKLAWSPSLVTALSDADRALGELSGLGRSLPNPHLLIVPFIRREAVLSSRIEGTQASLSDLYAYEARPLLSPEQEPTSDVREVHNCVQALEYGLGRLRDLPLSLRLFREIHACLMEGVRGERQTPGEFRQRQNWIGSPGCTLDEVTYVPPPMDEMHTALRDLERFLHAESAMPPLVRLGLMHYQFEAIHPFLDGNGRVGRLLITLLLCWWQLLSQPLLYLNAYFSARQRAYCDMLLFVSQRSAWEEWLVFFLRGVASQALDAVARVQRIQDLRERYREQFQSVRASARLLQLVDLLFARPVLTAGQVGETLGVTAPTAQGYVDRLEEVGVLREITGQARNRIYRADEVLEAIEELLESVPLGQMGAPVTLLSQ